MNAKAEAKRRERRNKAIADGGIDPAYAAACCVAVHRFAEAVPVGTPVVDLPELPGTDELALTRAWREAGVPAPFTRLGTGGPCLVLAPPLSRWQLQYHPKPEPWTERFARGLIASATEAMERAADARGQTRHRRAMGEWDRALAWFVSSFPLLGAVAAGFTLVVDAEVVRAWDIALAAVDAEHGEIDVNPSAALTVEEWRFVLAHEMLHAALRHDRRALGRDPYLWNVACDYVINGWLVAMGVGELPDGSLHDQQLTGMSAESVYDTLTTDIRRARKLVTLGGRSAGDVLGGWLSEPEAARRRSSRRPPKPLPWRTGDRAGGVDLDEFYRRALTQGLEYHHARSRGLLPLGLEQEIRALDHPPLPWDAQLARWFDEHVRAELPVRSYARASRRQSATPDIPRPGPPGPPRPARHLRRRAGHLGVDERGAAGQGPRRDRVLRAGQGRPGGACGVLRRRRLRRRLPRGRADRGPRPSARPRRHDPAARRRPAAARGGLSGRRADPDHRRDVRPRPAAPGARVPRAAGRAAAVRAAGAGLPRGVTHAGLARG
ncbi:hypothetical protein AB0M80_20160 [Amycolatopsis sp. NPDC051045]|uniref:vWA domain-containing protein n=1 Tax=Amycolatopsis sp. NPDC051045 TaxID=3156922 RepID=UPI00342EE75A